MTEELDFKAALEAMQSDRECEVDFVTIETALRIADRLQRFAQKQENVPEEFAKILEENFWDLLA